MQGKGVKVDKVLPQKDKSRLTEQERKLILHIRGLGYGEVIIYVEQGQPVRIEELKKSIKL